MIYTSFLERKLQFTAYNLFCCQFVTVSLLQMPCPSISMGPNDFGRVPIVLDGSNSFWSGPNHFG